MAHTNTWNSGSKISKAKIGGTLYLLKDADARANLDNLVAALKEGAYTSKAASVGREQSGFVTGAQVAQYVEDNMASVAKALIFRGTSKATPSGKTVEMVGDSTLQAAVGDVVIYGTKEFVYDGSIWIELGDEGLYATKGELTEEVNKLVQKTFKVAGLALDGTEIKKEALQTALGLKPLAYKSSGSVTISTVDSINSITTAKAGSYDVTGGTVSVPKTFSKLDVTPVGTVSISAGTAAAVSYDKATGATITASAPLSAEEANYTPAGSVSLPTVNTSVTLATEAVDTVTSKGTGYTMTTGSATKGSDTKSKFATKTASFSVEDDETLTIAYVDNSDSSFYKDAVTASGDVSYTAPKLSGALPTFGTKNVAKATGASANSSYSGGATFTGTGTKFAANISHKSISANVTQPTFTGKFSGTSKTVTPVVATSENATLSGAKITVGTETKEITAVKTDKTKAVSFS